MGFFGDFEDLLGTSDPLGTKATQQAFDIQSRANEADLAGQKDFFNSLQAQKKPVLEARDFALNLLNKIGTGEQNIPNSPGYNYQLDQGLTNIGNNFAAGGSYNSGGRYVAQQDYAAGLQSQDTTQQLNRLLNLAGYSTSDVSNVNPLLQQSATNQGIAGLRSSQMQLDKFANRQNLQNSFVNNLVTAGTALYPSGGNLQSYDQIYGGPQPYAPYGGLSIDYGGY